MTTYLLSIYFSCVATFIAVYTYYYILLLSKKIIVNVLFFSVGLLYHTFHTNDRTSSRNFTAYS